jgi:hypothetical protein
MLLKVTPLLIPERLWVMNHALWAWRLGHERQSQRVGAKWKSPAAAGLMLPPHQRFNYADVDATHRRRRSGAVQEVLAVGSEDAVTEFMMRTRPATHHGWAVTGACTPTGTGPDGGRSILDVPVLGDLDSAAKVAGGCRPRAVSVAQTPGWSSRLHHLAWDLEGTGAELVVDRGLIEIAGPRLQVAAVDGLPLLWLTEPAFTGVPRLIKAVGDWLAAALLLAIAPIPIALAIAVRSDGSPVSTVSRESVGTASPSR